MKRSFLRSMLLLLALLLLATAVPSACCAGEETRVVILATSDIHGNILGYSYENEAETSNDGMARLYTYIKKVREENPVVFLVDAGDVIQGNIMTDEIASRDPDSEHPVMAAMNAMGFDAMVLGNHEFDWGIETMKKITGQAAFPVLGANILDREGNYVTGNGWVILERGGVRLAVIGVCTPCIPVWDGGKEGVADTVYEAANTAVKKAVEEIGGRADILLVSAHMGRESEFDEAGGSDSGDKIVEDNPEVDILQVAHMHVTVDGSINGTPVVGVRKSGLEIARIDVTLDGDRKITGISTEIVDMSDYAPDPSLGEIPAVKALHGRAVNYVRGIGEDGRPAKPLGFVTAAFQPPDEILGLPEGKLGDTALVDLILKVELLNSGADVATASLFRNTSNLPDGPIYYRNIFDIYKYDNTLCRLTVTGRELKRFMEWSAARYNRWAPGDINISFNPEYPGYTYDMYAGVDYEINLSRPEGERIENVRFRGEPLRDDQLLKLAVNNYTYSSALRSQHLAEGKADWESSCSIRDMLVAYFAENSPVSPECDNNWRVTGADLSRDDPRRAEIIGYINERLLPAPYDRSYNLADYDTLVAQADANRAAGVTVEGHTSD